MASGDLPYSPTVSAVLDPLRRGFRLVNRYLSAPMIRYGAGPLLSTSATGSILVLRTIGWKTGEVREAPLGYALVDGRVVVVAGYGRQSHWFRNALAHPEVEVALPGAVLAGMAEEITDPVERRETLRQVMSAFAVVGRLTLGSLTSMDDDEVDRLARAFPMLAITPTAVLPGPYDPGGALTKVNLWLWAGAGVGGVLVARRRRHRKAQRSR